jgi:hypothetical protein
MLTYGQYRRMGRIKPIKGNAIPDTIICFDTETYDITDPETGKVEFPFRLGVVCCVRLDKEGNEKTREYTVINSLEDFIPLLLTYGQKHKQTYIFAHNTAFDLRVLHFFTQLNAYKTLSTPPIINERMFIFSVSIDGKTFTFLDTANFAVSTVKRLGKDMGFPKLEVSFTDVSTEDLLIYCTRDVDILVKFVLTYIQFIHSNDLGSFSTTLASQSLVAYRHRFMPKPIYLHKHDKATLLERSAYYGGRVEVFRKGDFSGDTFYNLDINSMYPHIMKDYKLPYRLRGYNDNTTVEQLARVTSKLYCIADVHLLTNISAYPVKRKGKLIFPKGQFRTTLQGDELTYALQNGDIKHVYAYSAYDTEYIFSDYVDFFYSHKVNAELHDNQSWRFISKIFLNALYGKFGQTNPHREEIGTCQDDLILRQTVISMETGVHYQEIAWLGTVYREWKEGEATYSFPAIAGATTSLARALLWKYILLAGIDNVFYCDTDSLIVNQNGFTHLKSVIDQHKLGYLKLEKSSIDLIIRGCKDYTFAGISKTKGIKESAVYNDKTRKYKQLQFDSMIAWMNQEVKTGATGHYIEKGRTGIYHKGVDLGNSYITPLMLNEPISLAKDKPTE